MDKKLALTEALNSSNIDYRTGANIINSTSGIFNSFNNKKDIANSILFSLSRNGKKRFWITWCLCGLELAYQYIAHDGKIWDQRKMSSTEYAYSHLSYIEDILEKNLGFRISLEGYSVSDIERKCFSSWLSEQTKLATDDWSFWRTYEWIGAIASELPDMHSTIKQRFFGGVVNTFDDEACFPMI